MADLKTDFQDDVLSESMNGQRRYRLQLQDDGSYILEDITDYVTEGDVFGAALLNQICTAINANTNLSNTNKSALGGLKFVKGSPPSSADPSTIYIELE